MPAHRSLLAQADLGRVAGRVVNSQTGDPLSRVRVSLSGSTIATASDLDGRFVLDGVPAGTVDVVAQRIGFSMKTVTGVSIASGETTALDVMLSPAVIRLDAFSVTAEAETGSAVAVLNARRRSEAVMDAVGASEIAAMPASDAADVAQRMTGVTVNQGRYVYVRGLGERYSQTTLNGSPLPSPEPEKEVVPLDLFPSAFLESVATQKSYTPDRWGDFSGGTVQIRTKDFPSQSSWSFGSSVGMNSQSHLTDNFLSYAGGGSDFLGVDDGSRALPAVIQSELGGLRGDRLPSDPATLARYGLEFQRQFNPVSRNTPVNRGFDGAFGTRTHVLGLETGVTVGVTYSDDYSAVRNDVEKKWRANLFDPSVPEEDRVPNIEYTFDRGTRNVRIGTIANLALLLSPTQKIGVRTTWSRNSEDEARQYSGLNNEDLGGLVQSDRLRFVQRDLYWGQAFGEHELFGGSRLEWRTTMAQARRDEPALRETIYVNGVFADSAAPYFLEPVGESGRYLWSDLQDDDQSLEVDWQLPFGLWNAMDGSVKLGGALRDRERQFGARRFTWTFLGGLITDIESDLTDDAIVGSFPGRGEFRLGDIVEPGDQYEGFDRRSAGYAMLELPFTPSLRVIGGARLESYELTIASRGDTLSVNAEGEVGSVSTTDLLPALNVIYDVGPDMSIRAAASRTLDRPEFRELAPFQFTEAASLRQIFGNPELQPTTIRSYDLRWDWFPRPSELVSASVFYKSMDDPIEQTFIAAASTAYSFQNADRARLYGVEFDVRKRLDFIAASLTGVALSGNMSIVHSRVDIIETGRFQPTNTERALEGQAGYTLNLSAVYLSEQGATELGGFFSRQGSRVNAAGGFGVPDIEARPRNQFDAKLMQRLGGQLRLSLKASNLLDSPFTFTQSANNITLVQREYRTGASFSVGLSLGR